MKATAICDGRGNAGTGARAVVLLLDTGEEIERAEKIPATTNIVAEHLSIQMGIALALEFQVTDLLIWNDSQTPVNHLRGTYLVTKDHLKPIVEETFSLARQLNSAKIVWVPREKTLRADLLCRLVDKKPAARKRPGGPIPPRPQRKDPFENWVSGQSFS